MLQASASTLSRTRGHQVRELVCAYRPLRDTAGRIVGVPTLALSTPQIAAKTLAPLLASEPVEVFAVACLSTRHRLLAWHVLSRGTRASTPVSMPDVFVPACLTPGTTALIVAHYVARHIMRVMCRRSLCGGSGLSRPILRRSLLTEDT